MTAIQIILTSAMLLAAFCNPRNAGPALDLPLVAWQMSLSLIQCTSAACHPHCSASNYSFDMKKKGMKQEKESGGQERQGHSSPPLHFSLISSILCLPVIIQGARTRESNGDRQLDRDGCPQSWCHFLRFLF